jgi:hypothetical protein
MRSTAEATHSAVVPADYLSGQTDEEFVKQLGEPLTPELAGSALVDLVRADPATTAAGYLLTGLQKLP